MIKFLKLNDFLKFSPFLLGYFLLFLNKHQSILTGDEPRYWLYANQLINGSYANINSEYTFLWNGPGYPIFLMPFAYFDTPLLIPKICNCLFIYIAIVFFYKTLLHFTSNKKAFFTTLLLACYYPILLKSMPYLLTESFSFFLSSLFIYYTFKTVHKTTIKNIFISAIILTFIILTKILFAYVVLTSLIIIILSNFHKKQKEFQHIIKILALSLLLCSPYLTYTYQLTNKVFYWGNSGGLSLYWMSSPYENENGDWLYIPLQKEVPNQIKINHIPFLSTIQNLQPVEKDSVLKQKAFENIKNNKVKYLQNIKSNISRLFFNNSFLLQKSSFKSTLILSAPNFALFFLIIGNILIFPFVYKKTKPLMLFLNLFYLTYLSGTLILSAYPRFLTPIVPFVLIYSSYFMNALTSNKKS